jgi:glucokinase
MRCSTDDFSSPREAIASFVGRFETPPGRASFALACPIVDDCPSLTNTNWEFDRKVLMRRFGWDELVLVNDLVAQARALSTLGPDRFIAIGASRHVAPSKPTLVIGPGTGLGIAQIREGGIAASEGGHAGFSPSDAVEMDLLRVLSRDVARVTNETVISGPGMVRLYRAFSLMRGRPADGIEGPEITRRAIARECPICSETCERFALMLGAIAGDAALLLGSSSVVLLGAIATSLVPLLQQGGFRTRFEARGPRATFLAGVPSFVTAEPDLGLHGALTLFQDSLASSSTAV